MSTTTKEEERRWPRRAVPVTPPRRRPPDAGVLTAVSIAFLAGAVIAPSLLTGPPAPDPRQQPADSRSR